jgi:hypothetical protein
MVPVDKQDPIQTAPVSVLPIFIPIFQLFALLPPIQAFYLWELITAVLLFFYLSSFLKKAGVLSWKEIILPCILCFPSFSNSYWGQVNLPLVICVGEFIRCIRNKQDLKAGLWIGGLILKPQLLILLAPIFLFQKRWKLFSGLSITILLALAFSILLGGWGSILGVIAMMFQFSAGLPTNSPEMMMNWRMVGERLNLITSPLIAWTVVAIGMIATALGTFLLWRKPIEAHSSRFLVAFTGTLAATLAITWHSHVHMAMVLIPPLAYLFTKDILKKRLFQSWIYCLPVVMLLVGIPFILLGFNKYFLVTGFPGVFLFIYNLIFLAWAWKFLQSPNLVDSDVKTARIKTN